MGDETIFTLDSSRVDQLLGRAEDAACNGSVGPLIARVRAGEGLPPEAVAALWFSRALDTKRLYDLACEVREPHRQPLETFSPLYLTNTCDADCRMCGMRRDNDSLRRVTADMPRVSEQLTLLAQRGMRAVALVTGEYRADRRQWAMSYVNEALRIAQATGFRHVLLNIGSVDDEEFGALLGGIGRNADGSVEPKLTMSTFQETYSPHVYAKFMGARRENPRADFERRLGNFDRAFRAGMRVANPGILVGLNPSLGYELLAFAMHAEHLLGLGMQVYLSVPRLRLVAGGQRPRGVGDEDFVRLVAVLALGLPSCKIVITTRESPTIQRHLAPIVGVISSGSSAVAPYTQTDAHFPLDESQFEVLDRRPFEDVLAEHLKRGPVLHYEPVAAPVSERGAGG